MASYIVDGTSSPMTQADMPRWRSSILEFLDDIRGIRVLQPVEEVVHREVIVIE